MHDLVTARGNFVHPRSEAFSGNGSQEYKRWTGDVGELVSLTCVFLVYALTIISQLIKVFWLKSNHRATISPNVDVSFYASALINIVI